MHIECLKIFCDLVDTQSFAKTALRNAITQSAVSQQVKTMEYQVQKVLLERHKRGLVPTAAGELFYQYAQEIVHNYETMQNEIGALHGVVSGTLRLACDCSFDLEELGAYERNFLKTYPDVRVLLACGTSRQIIKKIACGDADLGIATALRTSKNLLSIPFRQDALCVVVSANNALANSSQKLPVDALDQKPFIAFEEGSYMRGLLDRVFCKYRVYPHLVMELGHISMVKNAVEAEFGIAILPLCAVETEIQAGALVARKLDGIELIRPLSFLHRANDRLPASAQCLIHLLKNFRPVTFP